MKFTNRILTALLCLSTVLCAVSCQSDQDRETEQDAFAQVEQTTASSTTTATDKTTATTKQTTSAATTTTTAQTTTQTTTALTTTTYVSTTPAQSTEYDPSNVVTTTVQANAQLSFAKSGIKRDNAEFEALMNDLNNIMYPYMDTVSFTYQNLETGTCISFNADKRYNSCSTIKAPYCKMLLQSGIELDEEFVMTSSSVNSYSGRIDNMPVGTKFSVEYLIYRTIVYSDNTAYNMLYENCGWYAFNDMTTSLGLTTKLGSGFNYRKVSANEMAVYFKDIYNFCETPEGACLRDLLTDCDYNRQIGHALPQYEVAQKYGCQTSTQDLHDCAIVYAESPYVLTILSDLNPDSDQSLSIFWQISQIIDQINTQQTKPDETTTTTTTTTTPAATTTTTANSTTAKTTTTTPKTTTTKATTKTTTSKITTAKVTTTTTAKTTASASKTTTSSAAQTTTAPQTSQTAIQTTTVPEQTQFEEETIE